MSKRHISVGRQTWALLCKNFLKKWRMKRETLLVWFRVDVFSCLEEEKGFSWAAQSLFNVSYIFYSWLAGWIFFKF